VISKYIRTLLAKIIVKLPQVFSRLYFSRNGYKLAYSPNAMAMALFVNGEQYRCADEEILGALLRPGDYFVDVGANIGHLSLSMASNLNVRGLAIEANPRTFYYLQKNIILNHKVENIESLCCVLAESDNKSLEVQESFSDDCNSIIDESYLVPGDQVGTYKVNHYATHLIPSRSLDSIARERILPKDIRVLKLDIEGFELFAIEGAKSVLETTDFIYFEFWERLTRKYGYGAEQIEDLLSSIGFDLFLPLVVHQCRVSGISLALKPVSSLLELRENTNVLGLNRRTRLNSPESFDVCKILTSVN